ncbi:BTAD domain-containing putative transcriptional regulator [Kribbella italica]|nr:BTAD domain-containing putative transcriptional regulator [Kribbella italica]
MEAIVASLWSDRLPQNPRASVHTVASRLRRSLGSDAITRDVNGYTLCVDRADVDALRFTDLLDEAGRVTDSTVEHRLLREALELWAEPLSGDVFVQPLQDAERPKLLERYLGAVERRIDFDLAAERDRYDSDELWILTARHPFRESLWHRLLLALAAAGRRAEALEQYERLRVLLLDELGAVPAAELQVLHQQLLSDDDLDTVTENSNPSRRSATSASRRQVPRQLPADARHFTGREEILAAMDALVPDDAEADQPPEVVVLHGEAGVGKTSLAVHWAHQQKARFPDGQLYLNLRGYGPLEPLEVPAALAVVLRGLDVPSAEIPTDADACSALLRTELARRRMLLVLDNARNADQIRPLLPGASTFVVVTSRDRLSSLTVQGGVRQIPVRPLADDDARTLVTTIAPRHSFDRAALAEVVRLCGNLPLALAVVAEQFNRSPWLEPEQLISQLKDSSERLEVLSTGDSAGTDLRAVLSWSYQTLDAPTALVFRLIGRTPFDDLGLPAAAALTSLSVREVRRCIRRLADLHLINELPTGRVQLHDVLRAYARERSDDEDSLAARTAAIDRLTRWYLHTAAAARTAIGPPSDLIMPTPAAESDIQPLSFADHRQATRWFDQERSALVTLVVDAAARGRHELAAHLAFCLWDDLERSRALMGSDVVQLIAVESARQAGDPLMLALAYNQHGATLGMAGRVGEACDQLAKALELFLHLEHRAGELMVRGNLGVGLRLLDRHDESLEQLRLALDKTADLDTVQEARLRNSFGMTYLALGEYGEAVAMATSAIELHREAGDDRGRAYALDTLASAQQAGGDVTAAIENFEAAATLNSSLENAGGLIDALAHLGEAQHQAGLDDAARRSWQRALESLDLLTGSDQWNTAERTRLQDLLAGLSQ